MTDAQWLLAIVALIYLSDCLVWLPKDAAAVVIPFRRRPFVVLPSSWGNERGEFAFTTFLPARAVFVCEPAKGFSMDDADRRVANVLTATRGLYVLTVAVFVALFAVAPLVTIALGFARVGLLLIALFLLANAVVAFTFFRSHARVEPDDPWHRRVYAMVMLVATPSAIRAVDQVTRRALRDFDPLAVAASVAGRDDRMFRRLLRELAHPAGGSAPGPRYEAAVAAGLRHIDERPAVSGDASAYCPRCLALYGDGRVECGDCGLSLVRL